jgi:hypothetical protein
MLIFNVCPVGYRPPLYFLGAMSINYGVTVVLALLGSFALEYWTRPSLTQQLDPRKLIGLPLNPGAP